MFFPPLISLFSARRGRWGVFFLANLCDFWFSKLMYHFGNPTIKRTLSRPGHGKRFVSADLPACRIHTDIDVSLQQYKVQQTDSRLLVRLSTSETCSPESPLFSFTTRVNDKVVPRMPSWANRLQVCALSSVVPAGMKPCVFGCFGWYGPACLRTLNPWSCWLNSVKLTFLPCLPSHS